MTAKLMSVQRLFSMFPPGAPGTGLLLLRTNVAATFALTVANRTDLSSIQLIFVVATLIAVALTIGFLTPYLSFMVCVYTLVNFFGGASRLDELVLASLFLSAAALALLGPGAYSVDARLFGRRVLVVPAPTDTDRI